MSSLKLEMLPRGEAVLRARSAEIPFPLHKDVHKLIADMKAAVKKFKGIGLAAPQIGKNLKLAVINFSDFGINPFVIINPRLVSKSIKKTEFEEGCLSIPGQYIKVRRPAKIEIEFFREDGKRFLMKADGLLAKVFQHEIDHLQGLLIIDKKTL